ncbi:MAG: hypothetical protein KDJ90_12640 [Nitratireductor sp.]|nr:hypothetical protein [Nitratireductor sp.]
MADKLPVPANLRTFVEVLGEDLAADFFLTFGGSELYFAERPNPNGRLARLIGVSRAAELSRALDQHPSRVPLAKPWLALYLKERGGLSTADIARKLHAADNTVRGWLKRARRESDRRDDRQMQLF